MRFILCIVFLVSVLMVGWGQDTNVVQEFEQLQFVTMWGFTSDLWIMGGICALVCSLCFFSRS